MEQADYYEILEEECEASAARRSIIVDDSDFSEASDEN